MSRHPIIHTMTVSYDDRQSAQQEFSGTDFLETELKDHLKVCLPCNRLLGQLSTVQHKSMFLASPCTEHTFELCTLEI